jgi:hypothetical protein
MILMFPQPCLNTENNQEGFFFAGPLFNDPWPAGCLCHNNILHADEFGSDKIISHICFCVRVFFFVIFNYLWTTFNLNFGMIAIL